MSNSYGNRDALRGRRGRAEVGFARLRQRVQSVIPSPPALIVDGGRLLSEQRLGPGGTLVSRNERFRLTVQSHGVALADADGNELWSIDQEVDVLAMEGSGELVARRNGGDVWSSGTGGFSGSELVLQDDGDLVVYRAGMPVWSRLTGYCGDRLTFSRALARGEFLLSPSGRHRLSLRGDGNLVLERVVDGEHLWTSGTDTSAFGPGQWLSLGEDGNLTIEAARGRSIWSSGTAGSGAERLVVQDDGKLVLYGAHIAVWQRGA